MPSLIQRNTNWIFHAGKPVHLLREPGGAVWVLQEYTKAVDPSLTPDNLNTVGSKLKNLPKGWTFETKVLDKNLSLDTGRTGGWAAIIRDELQYLPGVRLRRGHQCQLRPLTCSKDLQNRQAQRAATAGVRSDGSARASNATDVRSVPVVKRNQSMKEGKK